MKTIPQKISIPAYVFILLVGVFISVFAYMLYFHEKTETIKSAKEEIEFVSTSKEEQLFNWIKDELEDAEFISNSAHLKTHIQQYYASKSTEAFNDLAEVLSQIQKEHSYYKVCLYSKEGDMLYPPPKKNQAENKVIKETINSARQQKRIIFVDHYRCPFDDQIILISFVAPIFFNNDIIGFLSLNHNAEETINKVANLWFRPRGSLEVILTKQHKDSMVVLNDLKFHKNSASNLKFSLSGEENFITKAGKGYRGIFEGKGYYGEEVICYITYIPQTNWYLITKEDKDEIFAPLKAKQYYIIAFSILLFLTISLSFLWIHYSRQKNIYQKLLEKEKEFSTLQKELEAILYSLGDALITTDTEGKVRRMNRVAERLTGWTETDAFGVSIEDVFYIVNEETRAVAPNPTKTVLEQGEVVGLANHTLLISKNGTEIPIADSGAPIKNYKNEVIGVVLLFRDQTEERKQQKLLQESEQKFRSLFETTTEIVAIHEIIYDELGKPVDYKLLDVNPQYEKSLNLNREDVVGQLASRVYKSVPPPYFDIYSEVVETQVVKTFETYYEPLDLYALISAIPLEKNQFATITVDITNLKKLEKELEFKSIVLEQIYDKVIITDLNGKIIYANKSTLRELNAPKEEVIGKTVFDVFDKNSSWQTNHVDIIQKNILNTSWRGEIICNKPEGKEFLDVRTQLIFDENNKPIAICEIASDITERKLLEEKIKDSENFIRSIFNSAPLGFGVVVNRQIIDTTEKSANMLGYTKEEVLNQSTRILYPNQEEYDKVGREIYPQLAEKGTGACEVTLRRKDGTLMDVYLTASVIDPNDLSKGYTFAFLDITEKNKAMAELKEKTEELERFFTTALDLLCIANTDGYFLKLNPEWEYTLGYSIEELEGSRFLDLVHPDDIPPTMEALAKLSNSQKILNFINRYRRKDGTYRWIEWRAYPYGGIIYASARDITEKILTQEKMEHLLAFEHTIGQVVSTLIDSDADNIEQNIHKAFEKIGKFLDVDRIYIFEFFDNFAYTKNTYEWCNEGIEPQIHKLQHVPTNEIPWWMEKIQNFETISIPKVADLPPEASAEKIIFQEQDIQSLIALPIQIKGELIGFIGFDAVRNERDWDKQEITILELLTLNISNIFKRIKAEESLRESEQRYDIFINSNPDFLFLKDEKFRYIFVNDALAKFFGKPKEEVIGKTDFELMDKQYALQCKESDLRTLENKRVTYTEEILGKEVYETMKFPVLLKNKKTGIGAFIRNITDKKQLENQIRKSEEKFRALVQNSSEIIAMYSIEGEVLYKSPAIEKVLGYKPEEVIGTNVLSMVHPEDKLKAIDIIANIIRQPNKSSVQFDVRAVHKDGSTRWLQATITNLLKEPGINAIIGNYIDITERQLHLEKINQLQREWEDTFQSICHPAVILDLEHNILYANNTALQQTNQLIEELKKHKCYEIFHGSDVKSPPQGCPMVELKVTDFANTVEMEMEAFGGVYLVSCSPLRDKDGAIRRVIHIATDITELKKAQKKLQEEHQKLELIIESTNLGIWEWNIKTNKFDFNEQCLKIVGYEASEIEPTVSLWEKLVHPDDLPKVMQVSQNYLERKVKSDETEYRILHKNGSWVWVLERAQVTERDADGSPTKISGIFLDITEQKKMEEALIESKEKYMGLFKNSALAMGIRDTQWRYVECNDAYCEMLGYTKEELKNLTTFDITHPEDIEISKVNTQKIISGEAETCRYEKRYITKKGEIVWGDVSIRPLKDKEGNIIGISCVIRDITEQKKLEFELKTALEKLKQKNSN